MERSFGDCSGHAKPVALEAHAEVGAERDRNRTTESPLKPNG